MVCGMVIPSTVRAFMLFRRAEIDDEIRRYVILELDYKREDTLHDQMEMQVLEILGAEEATIRHEDRSSAKYTR